MIDKTSYILSKFPDKSPNHKGVIHAHCPFHDDSKPSFSIDVEEGLFVCGSLVCGARGGFATFYKLMEGITSWKKVFEDLREVTTQFNLDELLNGKVLKKKSYLINGFPDENALENIGSIDYLVNRGIGPETIQAYGLRYGIGGEFSGINIRGSIVIPVWDIDHIYKTFQVRYLSPKSYMRWLNPEGSSIQDLLYGGWLVSPEDKELWIVEGASDTWRLHTFGVKAVGLNTKEASPAQLNKLTKLCRYYELRPIVLLDGDASVPKGRKGVDCSEKLFSELAASGLRPGISKLQYDEDPGGLSYERFKEVQANIRD